MKPRIWVLAAITVFTAFVVAPVHVRGQQGATPPDQHADHQPAPPAAPDTATVPAPQANMMASMMASHAKLDALVAKMNTATGSARTDAIAELLTAIVEEHHAMQGSMMSHMSMMSSMMPMMMNMMGGMPGHGDATPKK